MSLSTQNNIEPPSLPIRLLLYSGIFWFPIILMLLFVPTNPAFLRIPLLMAGLFFFGASMWISYKKIKTGDFSIRDLNQKMALSYSLSVLIIIVLYFQGFFHFRSMASIFGPLIMGLLIFVMAVSLLALMLEKRGPERLLQAGETMVFLLEGAKVTRSNSLGLGFSVFIRTVIFTNKRVIMSCPIFFIQSFLIKEIWYYRPPADTRPSFLFRKPSIQKCWVEGDELNFTWSVGPNFPISITTKIQTPKAKEIEAFVHKMQAETAVP